MFATDRFKPIAERRVLLVRPLTDPSPVLNPFHSRVNLRIEHHRRYAASRWVGKPHVDHGGDQFTGEKDVVGSFEQDGHALAELDYQARGDWLGQLDFDEINGGANQPAEFDAGLGHTHDCRIMRGTDGSRL